MLTVRRFIRLLATTIRQLKYATPVMFGCASIQSICMLEPDQPICRTLFVEGATLAGLLDFVGEASR